MTTLEKRNEPSLTPDSLVPIILKSAEGGPGGCFCRSDSAPQDGDSAGAAATAHSRRHPAPNAGPRHPLPPLVVAVSNPATEAEDNPGWSTSETSSSQFTTKA